MSGSINIIKATALFRDFHVPAKAPFFCLLGGVKSDKD